MGRVELPALAPREFLLWRFEFPARSPRRELINIERFALYSYEQGLTQHRLTPQELFVGID
jgi:hypothetical protein